MYLLLAVVLNAFALIVTAKLLQAAHFGFFLDGYGSALIAAIVLGLVNTFIKPILGFLTAPLNFLTLGLFSFVVSAIMLWITDYFVPGLVIQNWMAAILAAVVLSVVSTILSMVLSDLNVVGKKKK